MDSTEIPSFFLLVATPTPVTTTSLKLLMSSSREITIICPALALTDCCSKPIEVMERFSSLFEDLILKLPSDEEMAEVPPLMEIVTPSSGVLVVLLMTFPEMTPCA